ncbi:MAG: BtpA/SgcQ family protein [Anaerolineales bacterium]|nr:BtpA/SgcQ family protein [Anaerolineales bacterium]
MSQDALQQLFGIAKPVIAMAHFPPLPGTPMYDAKKGISGMLEDMRTDMRKLLAGGVDGILFCNEGDRPYALHADLEAAAVMASVITELRPTDRPFGVDFLWDPRLPIAVGMATGASFVREVFTGVYESDMGLWSTDAAATLRYRHNISADHIKVFFNVTPEFASFLGTRTIGQRAKSAVVSSLADAILVSGMTAGMEPQLGVLKEVKEAVGATPMLLNTGAKAENICKYLTIADGVIVGSSLKVDGYTWNPVDEKRVQAFMQAVKEARGKQP